MGQRFGQGESHTRMVEGRETLPPQSIRKGDLFCFIAHGSIVSEIKKDLISLSSSAITATPPPTSCFPGKIQFTYLKPDLAQIY